MTNEPTLAELRAQRDALKQVIADIDPNHPAIGPDRQAEDIARDAYTELNGWR